MYRSHNEAPQALRSESGVAMVMALVVVLILALISASLVNLAMSEYTTAAILDRSTQALLVAEAGAERAIAFLKPIDDWSTVPATTGSWSTLCVPSPDCLLDKPFPDPGLSIPPIGAFDVSVRQQTGVDARTNLLIRSVGRVRGMSRAVEFTLRRLTGVDMTLYAVQPVDMCNIPGGGSAQFHSSGYFEADVCLKGGSQAGFYNDRKLFTADAGFFNHLYVRGDLTLSQGNPTVGNPYWWVHVTDPNFVPTSSNFNASHVDHIVPPPFYPNIVQETQKALDNAGNVLEVDAATNTLRLVVCRRNLTTGVWEKVPFTDPTTNTRHLTFDATIFYLPRTDTWTGSCASGSVAAVRANGDNYMLFWDGTVSPTPGVSNLVFTSVSFASGASNRPVYVPGAVRADQNLRYEGKGSVFGGNQPTATTSGALVAQSGCAFDLNSASGTSCAGNATFGRWIRARISPCISPPGPGALNDNPQSTYARVNPNGLGPDVAVFFVNGSAYASVNASSCDQEMNLIAVVGDKASTATTNLPFKLQWYGVLMTRQLSPSQVPDFWQMPDLITNLPQWVADNVFIRASKPLLITNWRELF